MTDTTIRTPIRGKLRRKLNNPGPLYVPPELVELNKGYHLRWEVSSDRNPYSMLEMRRLGYEFVPAKQLQAISDALGDGGALAQTYTDGEYICTGTGAGTRSYLMRIRQELKDEIDADFRSDILENKSRIDAELTENPNIYKKKDI